MQQDDESFSKNMHKLRKNVKKVNRKKSNAMNTPEQDIFWAKKNKNTVNDQEKQE